MNKLDPHPGLRAPKVSTGALPASEKINITASSRADIRVPFREIATGEGPFRVYDPTGPYTDPTVTIDIDARRWAQRVCGAIFVVLVALTAGCATQDPVRSEEAAVLSTLESWNRGWATRDASLAVADYAADADWTNAFGDRFKSRDELQAGLEFIFGLDFVMAGDSDGAERPEVRFLSDDIALIRSTLTRTGQRFENGEVRPDRHIHHLRVLEKRDGEWVIVSHLISQAQDKR